MRVTAGIAKGRKLSAPNGYDTRPTSDKIKQSLFNIINNDVIGENFLDLFSGTGQIGIEALSRGANKCVFVEKNKDAMCCINKNIEHTKLFDKSYTYMTDADKALRIIKSLNEKYNIIFMDPPYNKADTVKHLSVLIKELELLKPGGCIICEHSTLVDLRSLAEISVFKEKIYGKKTVLSFFTPL